MELALISGIMGAAKRTIGMKSVPLVPGSRGNRREMSEEFINARNDLRHIFDDLRQLNHAPYDDPTVLELLDRRDATRALMNNIRLRDNRRAFKLYADTCDKLPAHVLLKRISASRRRKTSAGASLSSSSVALASYTRHFSEQFVNRYLHQAPIFLPAISPEERFNYSSSVITHDAVSDCLAKSPTHKAPGISGLCVELLHPVSDLVAPLLTGMFQTYLSLGVFPSSWTRALVCPVPKKGDLTQIKNYRPISLTETTRKIYEMVLMKTLQNSVQLSKEQGGFRARRSTMDQIEALDRLIKQAKKAHRRLPHLAFLDIKAAYDSVPRQVLWQRCLDLGLHPSMIEGLQALFDHNSGQLVVNQHRSPPFSQPAGVLQGSVLSPLLYSIFLDPLAEKLRTQGNGIALPFGNRSMNCLLYADDIALIASSYDDLTELLRIAEFDSLERGYRFSPPKCVILSPFRPPGVHTLYQIPLANESHFNYLGVEFDNRGIAEYLHVENRIRKADKSLQFLRQVGMNLHGFNFKTCLRLFKAFIRPGLEYGLPLLGSLSTTLTKLRLCQKRGICAILGIDVNSRLDVVDAASVCPLSMCVKLSFEQDVTVLSDPFGPPLIATTLHLPL